MSELKKIKEKIEADFQNWWSDQKARGRDNFNGMDKFDAEKTWEYAALSLHKEIASLKSQLTPCQQKLEVTETRLAGAENDLLIAKEFNRGLEISAQNSLDEIKRLKEEVKFIEGAHVHIVQRLETELNDYKLAASAEAKEADSLREKLDECEVEANNEMVSYRDSLAKTYTKTITDLEKKLKVATSALEFYVEWRKGFLGANGCNTQVQHDVDMELVKALSTINATKGDAVKDAESPTQKPVKADKCRSNGRSCDCGWSWDGGDNLGFPAPCPEGKTR